MVFSRFVTLYIITTRWQSSHITELCFFFQSESSEPGDSYLALGMFREESSFLTPFLDFSSMHICKSGRKTVSHSCPNQFKHCSHLLVA